MKWTVQPYARQDLPAIARFFKRHYRGRGAYGGIDLFQWKIIDNCLMPGIINLVKDGERIAATISTTPKRLFLNGHEVAAAEIGDTYTDPSYQRQGMFSLLVTRATQDVLSRGIDLVYGTPNSQSLSGYEKNTYRRWPNLQLTSLSLPINITPVVQRKAHWLLASYAGAIAATFSLFRLTVHKALSRSVSVEEISEIPDDWDEF